MTASNAKAPIVNDRKADHSGPAHDFANKLFMPACVGKAAPAIMASASAKRVEAKKLTTVPIMLCLLEAQDSRYSLLHHHRKTYRNQARLTAMLLYIDAVNQGLQ